MVHLSWLSSDVRLRAVCQARRAQSVSARRGFSLNGLCDAAGISEAEFFGGAVATAFELGILVPISNMVDSFEGAIEQAMNDRSFLAIEDSPRHRDKPIAIPDGPRPSGVLLTRRLWKLTQHEFAGLFMTTVRTVKRWESGRSGLTAHQQFFLSLFAGYVERNGVPEFRRRFVDELRAKLDLRNNRYRDFHRDYGSTRCNLVSNLEQRPSALNPDQTRVSSTRA
jgi:DNA-binding transcriptional regulator YiaG